MPHKDFHLLVKLYRGEQLSDKDLELFDSIIKDMRRSINQVAKTAADNYLPHLKLIINYRPKDEKAIRDYIIQTFIKTVHEQTGLVYNFFISGSESFKEKLNARMQVILSPSTSHSDIFIQSLKQGIKSNNELTNLKEKTSSLQKINHELSSYQEIAQQFLGKKVSPERFAFYTEIRKEQSSLEEHKGKGQQSSYKAAVRSVLHQSYKQVSERTVSREYKAFWSWNKNNS